MIPTPPPRTPNLGYLYFPPYRVQGYSVAGEETFVQIPELDVCFDIGRAPRHALASNFVALSHCHMDHIAGIAYYFSQRNFQGMGTGTMFCHPKVESAIHQLMRAWIDIEGQRTPYQLIPLAPEAELKIKGQVFIRAFEVNHTVPALGYVLFERRAKLNPELVGYPQEKIVQLKRAGKAITHTVEIPLIAYMGDTGPGACFERDDVRNAQILITECTFMDPEDVHRDRARAGKHLHVSDLTRILPTMNNEAVVITHLSRRTYLSEGKKALSEHLSQDQLEKIHFLMDYRTNRARYEAQAAEAEANHD